jgi:hypothetical protein
MASLVPIWPGRPLRSTEIIAVAPPDNLPWSRRFIVAKNDVQSQNQINRTMIMNWID